ncbi:MAG: peptide chain release factor N(5)-glutamine methyltransferase [Rhodobacteraceae bacterium]|nr:peptide chain release factor N(5)-glutamine methyltransferase [Paracoccaceae bacterium]
MRAADLLPGAVARLRAAGVADPARDARLLLAHALGVGAERLTLHLGDTAAPEAQARFESAIAARARRQPLAQITGKRLFWSREFRVTPDVLDPRPETETLIAAALERRFARVLDLGTGSGAILLTLLAERPQATGVGCDVSAAALGVAQANARALDLEARAHFRRSDWFAAVTGRFDLIVSNPPYVSAPEHAALSPEVRDWEPRGALVPLGDDGDGLADYHRIIAGAGAHLAPGGALLLEIGATQAPAVADALRRAGLVDVTTATDMDGRPRVVGAVAAGALP